MICQKFWKSSGDLKMAEQCFVLKPFDLKDRLDAGFYNPLYFKTLNELRKYADQSKQLKILSLDDLLLESENELGITGGATPFGAAYLEEGIQFIRVQNVRRNEFALDNIKFIPKFVHEGVLKRSQLKAEDVLLTITGMTYGLSAVVPDGIGEANINQHLVRIRVNKNKILPQYLSYFLNCCFGITQTDRYVTGATRPALDYGAIKDLKILFPIDIKVQEIVIKKVDVFVKKAKEYKLEYKKQIGKLQLIILDKLNIDFSYKEDSNFIVNHLNERLDAKFHSPFLNKLKEKMRSKPYVELGKIAKVAEEGSPEYSDSYKLIELDDIDEDIGEIKNIKTVIDLGSEKILLKEGQLIISKLQPEKGKVFLVDKATDGCVGSGELIPLELLSKDILPKYLWCILRSPYVSKQWEFETTGSTRERIGKAELYQTLIPMIDTDLQKAIISETEKVIDKAKKLKIFYRKNMQKANETFVNLIISEYDGLEKFEDERAPCQMQNMLNEEATNDEDYDSTEDIGAS